MTNPRDLKKAALRGEPSYVWREGQHRRLDMILEAAGGRVSGPALVNGCGVGMYLYHLAEKIDRIAGLDIDFDRLKDARKLDKRVVNGVGERLPFPDDTFSLILSHEVLEHVKDDQLAVNEMVRTLRNGGRLVLFCPNRGYPFETHGFYWQGEYHFGNIPLINYLPRPWRDKLAPHVRAYTRRNLKRLFAGLPVRFIRCTTIFGGYDNIIARRPYLGRFIRSVLYFLEKTPLRRLGLSHFWVVEKV